MIFTQDMIDKASEHIKDDLAASEPCTMAQIEAAVLDQCPGATKANYSPLAVVALAQLIQSGIVCEWEQYPDSKAEDGAAWELAEEQMGEPDYEPDYEEFSVPVPGDPDYGF
jgi:hypothetical protein